MSLEGSIPKDRFNPHEYVTFHIDQIKAADYTLEVIDSLDKSGKLTELSAIKETDVFRLRRGLCLPSASGACINWVKQRRVLGDSEGKIRIGDIFRTLAPFHGQKDFPSNPSLHLSHGWYFCTNQGDVYHQAIIALAQGLDVEAMSVSGFKKTEELLPILENSGAIAISLNNRFVPERSLRNQSGLVKQINGKLHLLIESTEGTLDYRKFEDGRHVVAVLKKLEDGQLVILDSYRLPQMRLEDAIFTVSADILDQYIEDDKIGKSRAILFAKNENDLMPYVNIASIGVRIPEEIVDTIKREFLAS